MIFVRKPGDVFDDSFEIVPKSDWIQEKSVANDNDAKVIRYFYDISVELNNPNAVTRLGMLFKIWRDSTGPNFGAWGPGSRPVVPHLSNGEAIEILDKCGLLEHAHIVNTENQNPALYLFQKYSLFSDGARGDRFKFENHTVRDYPVRAHAQGLMEDYFTVKSLVIPKLQTIHTLRHGESKEEVLSRGKQKYTRLLLPYSTRGTYPPDRLISAIRPEHAGAFCISQSLND